jgi:23S rRNA (uridine2552-2'-O)-methyltransferase
VARRVLHDRYFKQAKADGYVARSAYKLLEIDERFRLLRPGLRVLDLGCAPGSWLQVALERVGPKGRVVGIDLKEVDHRLVPGAHTLVGDLTAATPESLREPLRTEADGADAPLYDLVLSDMAPNTSGHGDHFLSVRLCEAILDRLPGVLRPGGALAMKVFDGEAFQALVGRSKSRFREVKQFKPKACRDVSRELYVVARGYLGPG